MQHVDYCNSRHLRLFLILLVTMVGGVSYRLEAQQTGPPPEVFAYADIVVYNGKILTVDDNFTTAEAVAIRDGKFLAVGRMDRILAMAGPRTRKIDLKGKTAIPGIVDTHMHPFTEGVYRHYRQKFFGTPIYERRVSADDMVLWPDAETTQKRIQAAVEKLKPGEPLMVPVEAGRGGRGVCSRISLEQLDAVSPNNPVFMVSMVNLWVDGINSKAVPLIKLRPGQTAFRGEGSPCVSDVGREAADSTIHWLTPFEEQMPIYRETSRLAGRWGITTAKEHTTPILMMGIRQLWKQGELTVRMRLPIPLWPWTGNQTNIPPDLAEDFFRRLGNLSGIGDDMWRLIGVRPEAVGGNIMAGSAWTLEPKRQELPGLPDLPYGQSTWYEEKAELAGKQTKESFPGRESLVQAIRYGWDVATDHTVGDRAVEEVLKAVEEGLQTQIVKRPDQILAMGHTPMSTQEQRQKMRELGIRNGIGPWHVFIPEMIESAFIQYGTERIGQMEAFNSYLKLGLRPSLEGDTFDDPPFWKFSIAVTRKDQKYGKVWNPSERVTRQDALRMGTRNGAYQLGEEDKLGSIEVGKLADMVVMDKDYMTVPEDEIPKIDVLLTIVAGKVVYEVEGGLK